METLLVINSILVSVCLYFIKDFHTDFKDVSKKVTRLDGQVRLISFKLNRQKEDQK